MATKTEAAPVDVTEQAQDPMDWIKAHRRLVTGAAVALAVVAGGAWLSVTTAQRKETAAQQALEVARNAFDANNLPGAASEFQRVAQTYAGTRAANEAQIALNQVRMINGQNELAIVSLRELVAANPDPVFAVPAQGLLGAALENVNRPAEAGEAFRRASELARVDYLKAEYLLEAGRAYVAAGQDQKAKEAYEQIVTDYAETPSMTEAQVRLAEVLGGDLSSAPQSLRGGS